MASNNYCGFTYGGAQYSAPATPSTPAYSAAPTAYVQGAPQTYNTQRTGYDQAYSAATANSGTYENPQAATSSQAYSTYDAALYSAASMYVAQQQQAQQKCPAWQQFPKKGQKGGLRPKTTPRPQQLHYCEVCKISCAGPQTYREHLDGQKHKKREASLKLTSAATTTAQNRGNNYHCELCDVTCTGHDAYAAHVRGSKHQKVVKLHQKLGKPIPADDPKKIGKINFVPEGCGQSIGQVSSNGEGMVENIEDDQPMDDIKPVGVEYIEEQKDDDGKILSFNCKLCECKFNDPNAKEMHMKGRRHRLQYKRKVQPDLVVDFKPTPRQRRLAEARAQRALMQAEYYNRRNNMNLGNEEEPIYWDERQRYDDEMNYSGWSSTQRGGSNRSVFGSGRIGPMGGFPQFFGSNMNANMMQLRRPESSDDRHAIARHVDIYPKEEELQIIQRIVSHTERALKLVSDVFTESKDGSHCNNGNNGTNTKEDGRDNQMFSFQKDAEGNKVRILKGVMRVGLLAKGLLLQGDTIVQLVVLCSEKPTKNLLKRVATELPIKIKEVNDTIYEVTVSELEGSIFVTDGTITVKVSLTSPLLREQDSNTGNEKSVQNNTEDLLPREPCLQALAALRHAKWFQARATGLQSCVMIIRILRDLCKRVPAWQGLNQWAMELLVEKIISSAGYPLTPGDCLRRIMEAISSGILISGPGILDPCEKEPSDALQCLSKQQREDLTICAQEYLRFISFRQIFKVLGMDLLPAIKYPNKPWKINRKRRRSGGETNDTDEKADEKIIKTDGEQSISTPTTK
ncbi:ZFR family protein [Megaselia abdita]